MKKIGEILKAERENKNLSLHEVGLYLKINPKILHAIEEGDTSQAPARTFLRGFVRSYAKYLRLDEKEILVMFDAASAPAKQDKPADVIDINQSRPTQAPAAKSTLSSLPTREEATLKVSAKSLSRNNILAGIVIISLLLVIFSVVRLIQKYQKESIVDSSVASEIEQSEEVIADTTASTTTTTLDISLLGNAAADGTTSKNSTSLTDADVTTPISTTTIPHSATSTTLTAVPTTTSSTTTSTSTTKPKVTTTTTSSTTTTTTTKPKVTTTTTSSTTTSTTTTKPKVTTTTVAANAAAAATDASSLKSVEIIAEAKKTIKISVSGGSTNPETIELQEGQVKIIKGQGRVQLEVQPADGVRLVVNGVDRGLAGKNSDKVKLVVP